MKLSVVVGTLNRLECLKNCINSILKQTEDVKIYVTDAGSLDGTVDYLKALSGENLIPIFENEKRGQAKAYNEIFARVDTPYVCWLSDDNVVIGRGLEKAVDILERDKSIGMVGLKTKDVIGHFAEAPYIGGISSIGVLNVNQGVLPAGLLKKLGGFDERFRDYGIDPDLTARVLFGGHKVVYTKQITIYHYRQCDLGSKDYGIVEAKQKISKELYNSKYAAYLGRRRTKFLKPFGECMMRCAPEKKLKRDVYNIVHGQYISWLDPLRSLGKSYHLIQSSGKAALAGENP